MAGWAGSFHWREEQSLCWSWDSISGKRGKGEACWQHWPLVPAGTLGEREQYHTQNGESSGAQVGKARYSDMGNPPGTLKVQATHRDLQGLQGRQELQQALRTWGQTRGVMSIACTLRGCKGLRQEKVGWAGREMDKQEGREEGERRKKKWKDLQT